MATQKSRFTVANPTDPDSFAAGSPDKFIGEIVSVLAYPHEGKDNKYYPMVGVRIRPDPDSGFEEFTRSYFLGNFSRGVISKDGETPAGATDEDYIALGNGKSPGLDSPALEEGREYDKHVIPDHDNVGPYWLGQYARDMGWHHFVECLLDSDEKKLLPRDNPRLDFCAGGRYRFDLVPQKRQDKDAKKREENKDDKKEYKILVVTKVEEFNKGKAASAQAAASSSSGSGNSELEDQLEEAVLTALRSAPDNSLQVGKIVILGSKFPRAVRGEAMGWLGERDKKGIPSNLVSVPGVSYDKESDTVTLEE